MTFARFSQASLAALLSAVTVACVAQAPAQSAATQRAPATPAPLPSPSNAAPSNAAPSNAAPSNAAPPVAAEPLRACGESNCLAFATPQAAFEYVLRQDPRVLAVGEAHAQQENASIPSSTRRFAQQLLPLLSGRAKHIVIELLLANCQQQTVTAVAKTQAPVTEHQAQSNQSEFLTLGRYAKRYGIEPQALTPTCSEYDSVVATGEDAVAGLLGLVADQTRKSLESLLTDPSSGILLSYGGALHNDLRPRPGQESWSFGPQLSSATQGRYVELDLIVPEFVKDSEAWRNLPWFSAFDRDHLLDVTLLYEPSPHSFTLIFPKTNTSAAQER